MLAGSTAPLSQRVMGMQQQHTTSAVNVSVHILWRVQNVSLPACVRAKLRHLSPTHLHKAFWWAARGQASVP